MLGGINPLMMAKQEAGFSTWSPSLKNANITLSGGDLVATSSLGNYANVFGTGFRSSGKLYFEILFNMVGGTAGNRAVGVGTPSGPTGNGVYLGQDNQGIGMFADPSGTIYYNGVAVGSNNGRQFASGNVVQCAVDFGNGKIWFGVGGVWGNGARDPATNTLGYSFAIGTPFSPAACLHQSGDNVTLNVGATSFANTVPSGFSAWG